MADDNVLWLSKSRSLSEWRLIVDEAGSIFSFERIGDFGDPGHLVVHQVPEQSEGAARPQHPDDLAEGGLLFEPMKRLSDQHGIDAGIGKRKLLGLSDEDLGLGRQPSSHLLERLERENVEPELQQTTSQLARSGSKVENAFGPIR